MDVVSVSPFRTGSLLWRRGSGSVLTLVVKASFALLPGESALATEQDDLNERENHWDDDQNRSLYAPSDLAPFKTRADVVLVGNAFAPRGKPVRSLLVGFRVGELERLIEVHGQRTWTRDGELREGSRWTKLALRYERAGGGPDTWNPVGVSPDAPSDRFGVRALPNLQPPGLVLTSPADIIRPVGFGPIASTWLLRREKLQDRADAWTDAALAYTPLGDDFDPRYFQVAPPDQQVNEIRDDERLVLENLHPEHPRLSTRLPGLHPKVFIDLGTDLPAELPMISDTLWIDTDRAVCTVTWRGQVPLTRPDQPGRLVVAAEGAGQKLDWTSIKALLAVKAEPGGNGEDFQKTLTRSEQVSTARALPFARADEAREPIAASRPSEPLPPKERPARTGPRMTQEFVVTESLTALPPWMVQSAPEPPTQTVRLDPPPTGASFPFSPPVASFTPVHVAPALLPIASVPLAMVAKPRAPSLGETRSPSLDASSDTAILLASFSGSMGTPSAASEPKPSPRDASREVETRGPATVPLELVWFEPAALARIRKTAVWAPLIKLPSRGETKALSEANKPAATAIDTASRDETLATSESPPDPEEVAEQAARLDISTILGKAVAMNAGELAAAVDDSLAEGGTMTPPLAMIAGEIDFPFDEVELLKATVGAAAPLAAADKKLKEILDLVGEILKTELQGAPEVVEALVLRVRDAWSKANRLLPPNHLETQPERLLLERRNYQKRDLLDGEWIRALFTPVGADAPVPIYLPAALARRLPLFKRFGARVIAEVHPQQDQYESHPVALRVLAIARLVKRALGAEVPRARHAGPGAKPG